MATDRFKWKTMSAPSGSENTNVIQAQFGDGYSQAATLGINNTTETWELSYTGQKDEVAKIRAFLNAHVITSFNWVNPWGEDKLYRVKNESIKSEFPTNKIAKLSFTFVQAYSP